MSYTAQDHANCIASTHLKEIRKAPQDLFPSYGHDQWLKGRISAADSLCHSVETSSAENEAKFLVAYHCRYGVYKT